MSVPQELMYTKTHEWVKFIDETTALIGVTDHAQEQLGDIVFVNMPQVGDKAEAGKSVADVESVKAVSDVYSGVSGVVSKTNDELSDSPELVNKDAYAAWFVEITQITNIDKEQLLTPEQYEQLLDE